MNKRLIIIFCALCICLADYASKELSAEPSNLSIRSVLMQDQYRKQRNELKKAIERRDIKKLSKIVVDNKISATIREQAAKALGEIGNPNAIPALLSAIENTPDIPGRNWEASTRKVFAKAIGQIGQPSVDPLVTALKSPSALMRTHAAEALGYAGDSRATKPLIVALNDSKEEVRGAAAEALGRIGDQSAIEHLISALSDENWHVRELAVQSLQKGLEWKPSTDDEKLAVLYADRDFYTLNRRGDPGAKLLIKALLTDGFFLVREKAAKALGDVYSLEAREALMTVAKSDDWKGVREAANSSLIKLEKYKEKAEEPLKTDLKVILSNPEFPSVVTTQGEVVTINFESNKSLEEKNLVLNILFQVGIKGVGRFTQFIYKGESVVKPERQIPGSYTMTSDKQGQINFVIATPQIGSAPDSYGMTETFLLSGKRSITLKLMLQEGKKEVSVSNSLSVVLEFK